MLLITTINHNYAHHDKISPEVHRYIDKLSDYKVIQQIERELNRNAIDADIHRDIIMPKALEKVYFPNGMDKEPRTVLGNLYFEPEVTIPNYTLGDLNLTTFSAYKHYDDEVKIIAFIIKRLFIQTPVWSYKHLWNKVREPPFGIEVNPRLFLEDNFVIALTNLVETSTPILSVKEYNREVSETILLERLFDYNDRFIYKNGNRYKIKQVDRLYILFPVKDIEENPINSIYTEYTENVRDKERAMIQNVTEPNNQVVVDVETYLRYNKKQSGVTISVDEFVKESKANINYISKKDKFVKKYQNRTEILSFLTDYSAQFQMTFLEEAISYIVTGGNTGGNDVATDETIELYKKVIELLDQFNIIIYLKEVRKYKDTAKQYSYGLPNLPDNTPLGYTSSNYIRLFDPQSNKTNRDLVVKTPKWFEVSKIAMNKRVNWKENNIIVGFFESYIDHMKFKIRYPKQKMKELTGVKGDTRVIQRGIVCGNKDKRELLQLVANLGISVSKLDRRDIRIRNLCELIKKRLIESEIKERGKNSSYKYLYSWWDEQVNLSEDL